MEKRSQREILETFKCKSVDRPKIKRVEYCTSDMNYEQYDDPMLSRVHNIMLCFV